MCALVASQGIPNGAILSGGSASWPTLREQEVGNFVEVHWGIVTECNDLLIRYLRRRAAEQVYQTKWQPTSVASLTGPLKLVTVV